VYLAAVLVGRSAAVTRRPLIPLVALAVAVAWAVGGLLLPDRPDTLGAVLFLSFAGFALRGKTPGVYAAAFALTAALELYGTHLGTWRWAAHDPTGLLTAANPPSGIPGGYCWLDFWALVLAPSAHRLLVRAREGCRALRLRLRPAPAAPS
jgi:hypothetical protein